MANRPHEAIKRSLPLRTKMDVCAFLPIYNVYSHTVPNSSRIGVTLNVKLKDYVEKKLEKFTHFETESFQKMHRALFTSPLLSLPTDALLYKLDSDVTNVPIS